MHHPRNGDYSASFKHKQLSQEAAQVERHRHVSQQDRPAPVKEELGKRHTLLLDRVPHRRTALPMFPLL